MKYAEYQVYYEGYLKNGSQNPGTTTPGEWVDMNTIFDGEFGQHFTFDGGDLIYTGTDTLAFLVSCLIKGNGDSDGLYQIRCRISRDNGESWDEIPQSGGDATIINKPGLEDDATQIMDGFIVVLQENDRLGYQIMNSTDPALDIEITDRQYIVRML